MGPEEQARTFAALDAWVGTPGKGLPHDLFVYLSRLVPLVNVDLLINDESGATLLTWRDDEDYGPGWHVPGGIIRYKETAEARIRATARAELGAEVEFDAEPIGVGQWIEPEKRRRGHFVSLLYRCRLVSAPSEELRQRGAPRHGQWAWHGSCPGDLIPEQAGYRKFIGAGGERGVRSEE